MTIHRLVLLCAWLAVGLPSGASTLSAQVARPPAKGASAAAWQASIALEGTNQFSEALTALEQLPDAERAGYLANFRRGWLLYRAARYGDSVAAYTRALSLQPASIEVRVALLSPLIALSSWTDVVLHAREVLKRDPENYLAMQRLALAQFNTQHFAEAESLYRHVLLLYPSDIDMRCALAWSALRMGKQREAAALFAEVLEVSAGHTSAQAGLQAATPR